MSVRGLGVTTQELEQFIRNAAKNISNNFVGVFLADHKHRFIDYKTIVIPCRN